MHTPSPDLTTLYPLSPDEERVLAQTLQFEASLPELMKEHAGKWAVWLDGLRHVASTHAAARQWARANLDARSPFVLAPVEAPKPIPLSSLHWPL